MLQLSYFSFRRRRKPWVLPVTLIIIAIAGVAVREHLQPDPTPTIQQQLFLLMRTQEITSEVFICPSTQPSRWDFGGGSKTAQNWASWGGTKGTARNLSFSYQNPYPESSR